MSLRHIVGIPHQSSVHLTLVQYCRHAEIFSTLVRKIVVRNLAKYFALSSKILDTGYPHMAQTSAKTVFTTALEGKEELTCKNSVFIAMYFTEGIQ